MTVYVSYNSYATGKDEMVNLGTFDSMEDAEKEVHNIILSEDEETRDDYQLRIDKGWLNFNKLDYATDVDIWELGEGEMSYVAMNDRYPTFEDYMF